MESIQALPLAYQLTKRPMLLFISLLVCLLIGSALIGFRQLLRLEHLNQSRVLNGLLIAAVILTIMSVAHLSGLFTQAIAAKVTMSLYTLAGGFFIGYGIKLISVRDSAGNIEYMHRSFWVDVAPNLIAVALFVFGIYRTGLLQWEFFTGIGITSGISLIGFGFWGWTVRVVPEFRTNGMLVLDKFIKWEHVVAYSWASEEILQIEYLNKSKKISEFRTYIPPEDQLIIERILGKKIKEYEEKRKQLMLD